MIGLVIMKNMMGSYKAFDKIEFPEMVMEEGSNDLTIYNAMHYPFVEQDGVSVEGERSWMQDNYAFAGVIPRSFKFFVPRNCYWTGNRASQK